MRGPRDGAAKYTDCRCRPDRACGGARACPAGFSPRSSIAKVPARRPMQREPGARRQCPYADIAGPFAASPTLILPRPSASTNFVSGPASELLLEIDTAQVARPLQGDPGPAAGADGTSAACKASDLRHRAGMATRRSRRCPATSSADRDASTCRRRTETSRARYPDRRRWRPFSRAQGLRVRLPRRGAGEPLSISPITVTHIQSIRSYHRNQVSSIPAYSAGCR